MGQFSLRLYPSGDLATEIQDYQARLAALLEKPVSFPYCPLIDDFDGEHDATTYVRAVDDAITDAPGSGTEVVEVVELHLSPQRHQLELSSNWITQILTSFSDRLLQLQTAPPISDSLQIVLVVPADEAQHNAILPLSQTLNWSVRAGWDIKLYQLAKGDWRVEGAWPVQQP